MKKILLVILITFTAKSLLAQQNVGINDDRNWTELWTNFNPKSTTYDEPTEILFGNITENKTLNKKNVYLLNGLVCLKNNATLTIEPGTVIRGDFESVGTLVITKGAKLIANGTETDPIVFTSGNTTGKRRSGDWGGLVIYGDAPINSMGGIANLNFINSTEIGTYGGSNLNSDSGILNYVRIEFAGKKINSEKENNGLSLAGVGQKTVLNNIQISFSDDDSVEVYGGKVNLTNLVSFRATDDDFDFTQGTQATITNSLALRNPFNSDTAISRCLEISTHDKKDNIDYTKNSTSVIANNLTFINLEESTTGLVKEAIYVKENSSLTLKNSLVHGFAEGIILDSKYGKDDELLKKITLVNVQLNSCASIIKIENSDRELEYNVSITKLTQADLFKETSFKKSTDFRMKNGSNFAFNK